ncbi:MAG TPA: hypothetical protein PKD64_02230 [Pirellulaceae bacterium]|nr:hypothetical protein [Pirellulaceae bacterium]HMO90987.1 hypothetical protein [Pirellulaceae bacterium]HMP68102.1 hypothetical protein [Pirellulaceae bacterium]
MRGFTFLVFTFLTIICWGLYGPILHLGQEGMADEAGRLARFKPFMAVGFAYFMIAVIYPLAVLYYRGESGGWSLSGFLWSFAAGAIGALGALGIILAFNYGGKPIFVMPLVFGCAPVINTFLTMYMSKKIKEASWLFYVGIAVVALGAAGVLIFKPEAKKLSSTGPTPAIADSSEQNGEQGGRSDETGSQGEATSKPDNVSAEQEPHQGIDNAEEEDEGTGLTSGNSDRVAKASVSEENASDSSEQKGLAQKAGDWFKMLLSILLTAFCWGAYGPVLHKGQAKMAGSRLRPFLCVGLAYFVIAVLVPIPFLSSDPGTLTFMGSTWSILAGVAGAFGALGIIYSFNFGGRPIFVMPLVFGMAPVVNTLSTTLAKGLWNEIGWSFKISLALVILGAVLVLTMAPKPEAKQKNEAPPLANE